MKYTKFTVVRGDHKSKKTHTLKAVRRGYVITDSITTLTSRRVKYHVKINLSNIAWTNAG